MYRKVAFLVALTTALLGFTSASVAHKRTDAVARDEADEYVKDWINRQGGAPGNCSDICGECKKVIDGMMTSTPTANTTASKIEFVCHIVHRFCSGEHDDDIMYDDYDDDNYDDDGDDEDYYIYPNLDDDEEEGPSGSGWNSSDWTGWREIEDFLRHHGGGGGGGNPMTKFCQIYNFLMNTSVIAPSLQNISSSNTTLGSLMTLTSTLCQNLTSNPIEIPNPQPRPPRPHYGPFRPHRPNRPFSFGFIKMASMNQRHDNSSHYDDDEAGEDQDAWEDYDFLFNLCKNGSSYMPPPSGQNSTAPAAPTNGTSTDMIIGCVCYYFMA